MDRQRVYDRREYVKQARDSFSRETDRRRYARRPEEEEEPEVRGYFKVRFALAVILFLAFLFVRQADLSYREIGADEITRQIRSTVELPDALPDLAEVIRIQ